MTVIAAIAHKGCVHMGADSLTAFGYTASIGREGKVFRLGELLIGCTGDVRIGQLLRHSFEPPMIRDIDSYFVADFVPAMRKHFKEHGYAEIVNSKEKANDGGSVLIGARGRIFRISAEFSVTESTDDFNACGCGEDFALAAMFVSTKKRPTDRLMDGLRAAERFSIGVRGPFTILSTAGVA